MRLPTVKVEADSELGYMIINVSDYDPERHVNYSEEEQLAAMEAEVDRQVAKDPAGPTDPMPMAEYQAARNSALVQLDRLDADLAEAGNNKRALGVIKSTAKDMAAQLAIAIEPSDNTRVLLGKLRDGLGR